MITSLTCWFPAVIVPPASLKCTCRYYQLSSDWPLWAYAAISMTSIWPVFLNSASLIASLSQSAETSFVTVERSTSQSLREYRRLAVVRHFMVIVAFVDGKVSLFIFSYFSLYEDNLLTLMNACIIRPILHMETASYGRDCTNCVLIKSGHNDS